MTCLEQCLRIESRGAEVIVEDFCPSDFGIMEDPVVEPGQYCGTTFGCENCWARQVPNTEPSKACRTFDTGAVRDDATGKGRFDLLPWAAIHALAKHCERGALHYGERNVDKGIPQHSLIDSGVRHLALYIQGDAEPHHLVAALWNIAWAVEQEVKRKHLVDLPEREGVEVEAV